MTWHPLSSPPANCIVYILSFIVFFRDLNLQSASRGYITTPVISMAKSKNGLTAVGLSVLGAFLVLLAFTTKSWLVTDGKLKHPKFERIGLWVVCFKDFEDPHHWYDTRFHSCWFLYCYSIFFSTCVLLTMFGLFYSRLYMYLNRAHEHYVQILLRAAILYFAAAICSTIALTIFGLYGDSRVWLPNWEHNDIGWSYGVAVAGTIALYVSGVLYGIECRVHMYKRKKMDTQRDNYNYDADDAKQMSHTDV